jgi:imidazolonepropionase-like amidohydrolase
MTTRIEADRLLPGRGDVVDDAVVVLDGRRSPTPARPAMPRDPRRRGGDADTVMPGLWDCHTHLVGLRRCR